MSKFENIMSKGIPVDSFFSIKFSEIYELCGDNDKAKESIANNIKNARKYFYDTYGITISDIMPMDELCIFVDPLTLKKDFYFSESNMLTPLVYLLNNTDRTAILAQKEVLSGNLLNDKLLLLKSIHSERDLKRTFPLLYEIYLKQKETYDILVQIYTHLEKETGLMALEIRKELIAEIKKDGCDHTYDEMKQIAFSFNVDYFCQDAVKIITTVFTNLEDILNYFQSEKIKLSYFTRDIKEKMQILILYNYLRLLSLDFISDVEKQKAIYYIMDCFKEMDTTKLSTEKVLIPGTNVYISYKDLYKIYKNALLNNPSLKLIDFSGVDFSNMSKEEIEEFSVEYVKDLSAAWEILPDYEKTPTSEAIESTKKRIIKSSEEKQKELEHLLDKLIEKKEFYGSINPMYVVKGINKFSGYFACIMPNGLVILDKYYENAKSKRLSKGDAIFIMRLDQFFVLSHYDRTYLNGNKLCKRMYHTKGWQDKVLQYTQNNDAKVNIVEELKKLLKVCEYIPPHIES